MPFIDASGVQVNFPFQPYDCQVDYMQKVVECLKQSENGILESPTGTGKTLCLLCSSLAWLENKKAQITSQRFKISSGVAENKTSLDVYKESLANDLDDATGQWSGELAPPKIIYASRTHSQLTQVVQELKRTAYSHFKICVLGSREQLCIHPQVIKEDSNTTKVHLCRLKVSARSCFFYNNVENSKANFTNKVLDVEDLVKLGKKLNCCPYYTSKELKSEAEVIFLPYNYLLDPKSRKAHGVELNNNIVIFDEAHNLEKMCEDSASFDWTSSDIAAAMRDLDEVSRKISELVDMEQSSEFTENDSQATISEDFTLQDVVRLKVMLKKLETEIDSINLPKPEGISKPGVFLFELLNKADVNFPNISYLTEVLDKLVTYLTGESQSAFQSKGNGLSKFNDVLKVAFSRDIQSDNYSHVQHSLAKAYKVHIAEEKKKSWGRKKKSGWDSEPSTGNVKLGRVLSYWCFSPGHAMEDLRAKGVRCIILTSGTLSPLDSFTSEMGIPFPIQLENPHVIDPKQIWIGVVGKGPDGTILSSAYENRFKATYQSSLGNAIVNFARVVPNGLLLFFPSYPVMDKSLEHWQEQNIWNRIEQYKPIFIEPKGKQDFLFAMENFYEKINDSTANGACFAAVCRGKVSEGLDFADNNGRAVVITGLPFPPRMDPKVILKMQYLDECRGEGGKGLSGSAWYRQQASRAVNQAIGRVIRHKHDFGAIILCDTRFGSSEAVNQLPLWIRPKIQVYTSFGSALKDMMIFFKSVEKIVPVPAKKNYKRNGEPGCQGAFFEPTAVRSSNKVNVSKLPRSCDITTHVPSLQQQYGITADTSLAKIKIQYETNKESARSKCKPKGLFDALSVPEKEPINIFATTSDDQKKSKPKTTVDSSGKARKKIILKKDNGATSGGVVKQSAQTAEQYLIEVKQTLSVESYQFFSKTLTNYKRTSDFNNMIAGLAEIFTDDVKNYHLFKKFYRFVRSQHKEEFDEKCKELTGGECGYRADSTKKRVFSGSTHESAHEDKKQKFNPNDVEKSTAKTSSANVMASEDKDRHLNSKTHLNIGNELSSNVSKPSPAYTKKSCPDTADSTESTSRTTFDTASSLFSSQSETTQNTANVMGKTNTINVLKAKSENTFNGDESFESTASSTLYSECHDPPMPCTVSAGEAYLNAEKYLTERLPNSGHECAKCEKDARVPLKALCNHVCCMECWKICIRETKQCPKCHQRVKRKHLQRLFFSKKFD